MIQIKEWDVIWYHIIISELDRKYWWDRPVRNFLYKCNYCWKEKEKLLHSIRKDKNNSCWCKIIRNTPKWKNNWMYWKKWILHPNYWKRKYNHIWNMWFNQYIRNSSEYRNWRTNCFQRDNYTCQLSWIKWWELVVHHLNPFSIIISDLDDSNFLWCEKLFDINNWITISREIHNKFHNEYWKVWFTIENFYEFKNKYFNI